MCLLLVQIEKTTRILCGKRVNKYGWQKKSNSSKCINFNCCLHCHTHSEQMIHWLPVTIVAFTFHTHFDFVHILIIAIKIEVCSKFFHHSPSLALYLWVYYSVCRCLFTLWRTVNQAEMHFATLRKGIYKLAVRFGLYASTCSSLDYFAAVAVVVVTIFFCLVEHLNGEIATSTL